MHPWLATQVLKVTPLHSFENGAFCYFLRLDERWGAKLYRCRETADNTYNLQNLAAQHGLAPIVGDKFEIEIARTKFFAYITECVEETALERHIRENGLPPLSEMEEWEENDAYEEAAIILTQFDDFNRLCKGLKRIGIAFGDNHAHNVGWMKSGKLVAIDFSEESSTTS
jgi:hypothetical protein